MKAKLLIAFTDGKTGKTHKAGDTIDVTAKRFNEISAKGRYLEAVEAKEPVKAQ